MSDPVNVPLKQDTDAELMGAILSKARERQNLSIDDICTHLRISPRQVLALESNDFSALPEPMITRGFIRNYARMLGIDAEPLLQAYRVNSPSEALPSLTLQSENILISGKDRRPWMKYILASIMIALLVGAWQIYMDYMPKHVTTGAKVKSAAAEIDVAPAANVEDAATTESLPMPALPAAERTTTEAAPSNTELADSTLDTRAGMTGSADIVAAEQPAVVAGPTAKLKLSFSGKSWVNVTDKNKKVIFDRIMQAGSEQVVEGQAPLAVVIGNAPVSTLVFNDKLVDLAPYTKVDVARVILE